MISDQALRRVLPRAAVDLLGDVIRWLAWAGVFMVWASFAQVYARMIRLTLTDPSHSDFTIFYYTARLVADGLNMYGVSPRRYGVEWAADHLGNLNPPHVQLLFLPLARLTYGQALALFVGVSGLALAWSLWRAARELGIAWTWSRFFLWGALTLSSAAFTTVAVTCEVTFLLMVPFTLAWCAWRQERWAAFGFWLGLCASSKLFLLLFVPVLVWQRRWRAVAVLACTLAAAIGCGVLFFGAETLAQWIRTLGRVGWWWIPMNASWHGFVSRTLGSPGASAPMIALPDLVKGLATVGAGVVAIVAMLAVRPNRTTAIDRDRSMLIVLLGAILASPLGWVYYLPLAYGPVLGWLEAARGARSQWLRGRALAAVIVAVCLLYVPQELASAAAKSGFGTVTLASAYFWAVAILWVTTIMRGRDTVHV